MNFAAPTSLPRPSLTRGNLALYGFLGIMAACCTFSVLTSMAGHTTVEGSIYSALGCRSDADVLILTLQPDGRIQWPDRTHCTVEESAAQLPAWCADKANPMLAVLADQDALLVQVTPLLEAAQDLGLRQAILATPL